MAKFEDLGYCPYNAIFHTEEKVWNELTEGEKEYRKALWELVGSYMVCKSPENVPYVVEADNLFFGTKSLANKVLVAIIKKYDFKISAPIWITQPRKPDSTNLPIAEFIVEVKENEPEVIFDSIDAGKIVAIYNGDNGEIFVALWNTLTV